MLKISTTSLVHSPHCLRHGLCLTQSQCWVGVGIESPSHRRSCSSSTSPARGRLQRPPPPASRQSISQCQHYNHLRLSRPHLSQSTILHTARHSHHRTYTTTPRHYASHADSPPSSNNNNYNNSHEHPPDCPWPSTPNPTPYEIFNHPRTAPYTKARYYALVKIYHPDRHHQSPQSPSQLQPTTNPTPSFTNNQTRLHRYRLIVHANSILSDPTKRAAYDKYGAGWGNIPSHDDPWSSNPQEGSYPYSQKDSHKPDSPFRNATWEDWEEWNAKYGPHAHAKAGFGKNKQDEIFMSSNAFAGIVVLLMAFAAVGQVVGMGQYGNLLEDRVRELSQECALLLSSRRKETVRALVRQDGDSGSEGRSEYDKGLQSLPSSSAAPSISTTKSHSDLPSSYLSSTGLGRGAGGETALSLSTTSTTGSTPNSQGRVKHFLKKRDPTGLGLKSEEEGVYSRELGSTSGLKKETTSIGDAEGRETCGSASIEGERK